jgi:hypothetical protein
VHTEAGTQISFSSIFQVFDQLSQAIPLNSMSPYIVYD